MPCYNPLTGYKSKLPNPTGKYSITFKCNGTPPIAIPCGQCIGCRLERSRQWAIRCVNEAQLHIRNCFITLTYDEEHTPPNGSLVKRDFVLFMKKVRNAYGSNIRFFHCGEYGEQFQRPHHHACIFNLDFPDKTLWSVRGGVKLYRSKELESLWPYGYSTIGEVTFESAAYVARYVTKKITGVKAADHYKGREPEYITFSIGIGKKFFEKYSADMYNYDHQVIRGETVVKPAKYYDKLFDRINSQRLEEIKCKRKEVASKSVDNSRPRLQVRQKCKLNKLLSLKRTFESIQEPQQ